VGLLARAEDQLDRAVGALLDADAAAELAVQDIEGLVLAVVDVQARAEPGGEARLDQAQGAAGAVAVGLEGHQGALPPEHRRFGCSGPVAVGADSGAGHGPASLGAGGGASRVEMGPDTPSLLPTPAPRTRQGGWRPLPRPRHSWCCS
jgi:hypothetical protein